MLRHNGHRCRIGGPARSWVTWRIQVCLGNWQPLVSERCRPRAFFETRTVIRGAQALAADLWPGQSAARRPTPPIVLKKNAESRPWAWNFHRSLRTNASRAMPVGNSVCKRWRQALRPLSRAPERRCRIALTLRQWFFWRQVSCYRGLPLSRTNIETAHG